jgi:nucleotide-binding universal stress UspA family protein
MYKKIIWATDGSPEADLALEEARRLARLGAARIVAVHCDQRLTGRAAAYPALGDEDDRRRKIRRQVKGLRERGVDIELLVRRTHQEPADVVAAITDELGGDVIVCGTRRRGALSSAAFGSFTHRLVHVAPCPVLAVPLIEVPADAAKRDRVEALA